MTAVRPLPLSLYLSLFLRRLVPTLTHLPPPSLAVNDSPSLKRSDVGIAMGQNGSDVAKDASDIVLADDNFASILAAVEEGRRMFTNIQKFVLHLLAGNVMQALVLLIGLAFKDDDNLSVFPLAPVEILWVIMITSSFPAMGLGAEKADPDILTRKPHNLKMGVFAPEVLLDILVYGIIGAAVDIGTFAIIVFGFGDGNLGRDSNNNINGDPGSELVFRARSATWATMVFCLLWLAFEMMDLRRSFFHMGRPGTEKRCVHVFLPPTPPPSFSSSTATDSPSCTTARTRSGCTTSGATSSSSGAWSSASSSPSRPSSSSSSSSTFPG